MSKTQVNWQLYFCRKPIEKEYKTTLQQNIVIDPT